MTSIATPPDTTTTATRVEVPDSTGWDTVHEWYHSLFTGIVVYLVAHKSVDVAARTVYEVFSRQRQAKFLPGLQRLGLDTLPPAVAAAQYHYLSNNIGGVSVEFIPESEHKAWIRYRAPRWIWAGTALCAIPTEVSRAMLAGWHAQNGVSLNNPRLGFVCTKQTTDGQSSLEGYYYEYDHDLRPDERLQFARHEDGPPFDPAQVPTLPDASWPAERVAKARRNYAIEYVRTLLPAAVDVLGPGEAAGLLTVAARMVGLQHYHAAHQGLTGINPDTLGQNPVSALTGFSNFVQRLGAATGDLITLETEAESVIITQQGWRLYPEADVHSAVIEIWAAALQGAAAAHDPRLDLRLSSVTPAAEGAPTQFKWTLTYAPRAVR